MLRITKQAEPDQTILRVEGKLVRPFLEELENCWRTCRQAGSDRTPSLVLDLRSVTFVGVEGKELLSRIYRSGATFMTSGIWMSSVVKELQINSDKEGK